MIIQTTKGVDNTIYANHKISQKKLKQDKKRTTANKSVKAKYKSAIKKAAKKTAKGAVETVKSAYSAIDRAAKKESSTRRRPLDSKVGLLEYWEEKRKKLKLNEIQYKSLKKEAGHNP